MRRSEREAGFATAHRQLIARTVTGFVNRDGSLNVFLDALPVNGKPHIRDVKPEADAADAG